MAMSESSKTYEQALETGYFGPYGGQFVDDNLKGVLNELTAAFLKYKDDPDFNAELTELFAHYCGRPTPVFHCRNLSAKLGGAQIYLKREDLNHLGAHKLNNTLGQALLAKRMGKTRLVAETGAGSHGNLRICRKRQSASRRATFRYPPTRAVGMNSRFSHIASTL